MSRAALTLTLALLLSGCSVTRAYVLAAPDRAQHFAALIDASQELGLFTFRGNGALTQLKDGSELSWEPGAAPGDIKLTILLPNGVPDAEQDAYFAAGKAQADAIWARAAALRGLPVQPPPAAGQ